MTDKNSGMQGIIRRVADQCGITQKAAKKVVTAYENELMLELKTKGYVKTPLVSFKITDRAERTVSNPQTHELQIVPARKVIKTRALLGAKKILDSAVKVIGEPALKPE
jgi:nucleoid DNA-binding protein